MPSASARHRAVVRTVPAILWAGVIIAGSSVPGSMVPGRFGMWGHFLEYAVLGVLVTVALGRKRAPVALAWWSLALCAVYAASDELHQLFVPMRMCDPLDWTVDVLGSSVGICAAIVSRHMRAERGTGRSST
jgi:VanZ family protein